jgi:hypothetical protein
MSEKIELDKPVQNAYGWYVGVKDDYYHYLHADGVIRDGATHSGNDSGYFTTEAEALAVIARYEAKQAEATQ